MQLSELIPKSIFSSIGTIKNLRSLDHIYGFINYNKPFIEQFDTIVVSLNKMEDCSEEIAKACADLWLTHFKDCHILFDPINKGHMFGTIDLEENILRFVKERFPERPYLFKSTDDVLLTERLLGLEVPPADFYYLPSFSYETIVTHPAGVPKDKQDILEFVKGCIPQTNFYIIDVTKITSLYGEGIDRNRAIYEEYKKQQKNIKPWEINYGDGMKFDMETCLNHTAQFLSRFSLLKEKTICNLYTFVVTNKVGDPAHKNIYFAEEGVCHFHFSEDEVFML